MSDIVRLAFAGPTAGHLDVAFDVVAKVATALAIDVDGVADASARSGLRRLAGAADAPVTTTVTRTGCGVRITLHVDACWGTPLGDLAERLRRTVSDGLNASLGTALGTDAVWVRFDAIRFDPAEAVGTGHGPLR